MDVIENHILREAKGNAVKREVVESLGRSKDMDELAKSLNRKGITIEIKENQYGAQTIKYEKDEIKYDGKELSEKLEHKSVVMKLQENREHDFHKYQIGLIRG